MKPKLILICGLPGAGKTTLAKKLEREENAVRLCPDEWIYDLLHNKDDLKENERIREHIEQLLWKLAQKLLGLGNNVIMENGFWVAAERNTYLVKAKALDIPIELHFLNPHFDELWQRLSIRNKQELPGTFKVTKENLKQWSESFEAPTKTEGENYDFFMEYK